MNRLKVMTVVGTRPEIIRLSRVMVQLSACFEHVLVHTGQNYDYELNQIFFEQLDIGRPKYFLNAVRETPVQTTGQIIQEMDKVLIQESPDALLVLGDTNSCLAAYSAKRHKVPVFHMEAGNRCFDQRVPEEINRKLVDHLSDINLPYSDISRSYLLAEGIPSDRVIKTGSPLFEVLNHYKKQIQASEILNTLGLKKNSYFILSCHREENVSSQSHLSDLLEMLDKLGETYRLPIIFSTHPRTRKAIESLGAKLSPYVRLEKPFGFFDFVFLQQNARAVLSDSGTITEESSLLEFPAVNIRDAHERPEGMEEASVVMTGLSPNRVLQGLELVLRQRDAEVEFRPVQDYLMPNVSHKVVRIIQSYTQYVNQNIWKKS